MYGLNSRWMCISIFENISSEMITYIHMGIFTTEVPVFSRWMCISIFENITSEMITYIHMGILTTEAPMPCVPWIADGC